MKDVQEEAERHQMLISHQEEQRLKEQQVLTHQMEQFSNVVQAHEKTVQAQLQIQRTLQEEKVMNNRLLQ